MTQSIGASLLAAGLGFLIAFLLGRAARAHSEEKLAAAQTSFAAVQSDLQQQRQLAEERGQTVAAMKAELAAAQAGIAAERDALARAESKLNETFESLASKALQGNAEQFMLLARAKMEEQQKSATHELATRKAEVEQLVKPITEALDKFNAQVQQIEQKREGAYAGITEQLKMLSSSQETLKSETSRLVGALKTPIHRGRWGEVQLRRVVELAGMVEHCDFEEQPSYETDEGRQRPDLIVHLPGGRQIVVDSKVSLAAYLEAANCENESQRAELLRQHAAQIKAHMVKLSSKSYWQQLECTPEFVVAFVPGESFFAAALQHDGSLIEFGADQRVILATPTTLIALLKAVAYGWRQEQLQKNAEEISVLGKQLHERLTSMYEHFHGLRRNLDAAVNSFNKMVSSMETRVMVSARKFRELGAAGGDEIEQIEPIEKGAREIGEAKAAVPGKVRSIAAGAGEE